MIIFSWYSVLFYCLFEVFLYYQQLHLRGFRGKSQIFKLVLTLSLLLAILTGITYLIYYGWAVVWWAPIIIFAIGFIFTLLAVFLEQIFGVYFLSIVGFLAWPMCAYLMFRFIPTS
jgi:hypothetical protein